jgi:hypothetical protein
MGVARILKGGLFSPKSWILVVNFKEGSPTSPPKKVCKSATLSLVKKYQYIWIQGIFEILSLT